METLFIESEKMNPKHTFECGQCFRWQRQGDAYLGVVDQAVIKVERVERNSEEIYKIECVLGDVDRDRLWHYFDLDTDYEAIGRELATKDDHLRKAIALSKGLRLLNQAPFETLITFIISSNNNIPKIKLSVEALSQKFGQFIGTYEGQKYYAFPTLDQLSHQDLEALRVKGIGYRNKSVYRTVQQLISGEYDLLAMRGLNYQETHTYLKQFYGVGDKVADCVALFAYGKREAFPIDTWVKKMLKTLYGVEDKAPEFVKTYFTSHGGYAQQYLFYYMRSFYGKGL